MVRSPAGCAERGERRSARALPECAEWVVGIAIALVAGWAIWNLGVDAVGATVALAFSPGSPAADPAQRL
jgi:hypothetical protein